MRKALILTLSLLSFASFSFAADAISMLKSFSQGVKSASGEFTQEAATAAETSKGSFAFSRPGKFLWETKSPFHQKIVSDAKTLWIYDADLSQVTVRRLKGAIDAGPASLLFGGVDPETQFDLKLISEGDSLSWVRATPKAKDAAVSLIDIGFNPEGTPEKMRLTDRFGEKTTYTLENVEIPSKAGDAIYSFKVPAGVDVLEDTSFE